MDPRVRQARRLKALLSLPREPTPFELELYTLRGMGVVKVALLIASGIDSWDKVTYEALQEARCGERVARNVLSYMAKRKSQEEE